MPATGIVRITDTLQYIPKAFAFPKSTTENYLQQSNGDIISIMKDTPQDTSFLVLWWCNKNAINNITHILHISTSQPRLQTLPLPPLLPQTQSENLQLQNIPSILVPALGVEPVSQPPRVKNIQSEPTPPTRLQPFTSSSLDIYPNPLI